MAGIAAKSYCDALFEIAKEENKLDIYKEQLLLVKDTMASDTKFVSVMNHPKIHKEEKKQLLETIYEGNIEHMLLNFLKILVDKNRFRILPDITKEFVKCYNVENHIQVVYVNSATALDDEQIAKLKVALMNKLNQKVELVLRVDEDLMAGIRIKINDQIIDNTAKNKLERLKQVVASEANK